MQKLLTNKTISLTELRNPKKLIESAGDDVVAILNRNKVIGYFVPHSIAEEKGIERIDEDTFKTLLKDSLHRNREILTYLKDK